MFKDCNKLENLNINNFAPDIIRFMPEMFRECHSLASLDLSKIKTANVKDMSYMFYNTKQLAYLNLANFDTSDLSLYNDTFYNINDGKEMEIVIDLDKCEIFKKEGVIPAYANITKPGSSFE